MLEVDIFFSTSCLCFSSTSTSSGCLLICILKLHYKLNSSLP